MTEVMRSCFLHGDHAQEQCPKCPPIRQIHPFAVQCKCGKTIVWFFTKNGKKIPVDEETTIPTDRADQLDLKHHRSHFATCPNADKYRRRR